MLWQGKIDFQKPVTLNGKPHGVDQFDTMPEWDISFDGQIFYVASEKKVYVGTNTEFIELSPSSISHDHNYLYHTRTEINSKFDVGSGHDHDGTNSKKVTYSNLSGIPTEFNSIIHDNGRHSVNYITAGEVSFNVLNNNSLVGTGSSQISRGDHLHDGRYFTETELSASTGAALVGVSNILNQTTVQNAFQSVLTKFNDYRLTVDSYTKTEVNSGFVDLSGSQEIFGAKSFNDSVTFKNDLIADSEINIGSINYNFSNVYTKSITLDAETYTKTDLLKASELYTRNNLQTSGSAQVHWQNLTSVPPTFTPSTHNHDTLYYNKLDLYTKTESDGRYSLSSHDHNLIYALISHNHTKSNITNFVESDYVHIANSETITGLKTFNQIIAKNLEIETTANAFPGIFGRSTTDLGLIKYDSTINNFKIEQFELVDQVPNLLYSSLIATRNDSMTTGAIPVWNDTQRRFDSSLVTISGSDILGNASTATKLATPRTINGVDFDGSSNINISTVASLVRGTGLTGNDFDGSTTTTWAVQYGTTSTTACVGNDSRLSDARDPKDHLITSHTASGLTTGQFLKSTSATEYAFESLTSADITDKATTITDVSNVPTSEAVKTYVDERGFIPAYGMIYSLSFSTTSSLSTKAPLSIQGVNSNVNIDTNSIIINVAGIYSLSLFSYAVGIAANKDVSLEIRVNGVIMEYLKQNVTTTTTYNRSFSISGILNLNQNDELSVYYTHPTWINGTDVITFYNTHFNLIKIA